MRILVTGGAGFIGKSVCEYLLSEGHAVSIIDDFSHASVEAVADLPVDLYRGNILDDDRVQDAMVGVSSVIHLAALVSVKRSMLDPRGSVETNTLGTLKVLEHARRCGAHVTIASTAAVYGQPLPSARHCPGPTSPYGGSKLAAEVLCQTWHRSFGLPIAILRIFNCYGPGQRYRPGAAPIIPTLIHSALTGELVPIDGDGQQTRCFVHRDTVAECLGRAAVQRMQLIDPVDVAPHPPVSIMDVAAEVIEITGASLRFTLNDRRPGDILHSNADLLSFRRAFAKVAAMPLRDGLLDTLNWFLENPDQGHLSQSE